MFINIIKAFLNKISRILYNITPIEFRQKFEQTLFSKLQNNLVNETLLHFEYHIKNSLVFRDV